MRCPNSCNAIMTVIEHNNGSPSFMCPICNYEIPSGDNVIEHLEDDE
jgi:hypothetical protein